jgi:hypothetical protein
LPKGNSGSSRLALDESGLTWLLRDGLWRSRSVDAFTPTPRSADPVSPGLFGMAAAFAAGARVHANAALWGKHSPPTANAAALF